VVLLGQALFVLNFLLQWLVVDKWLWNVVTVMGMGVGGCLLWNPLSNLVLLNIGDEPKGKYLGLVFMCSNLGRMVGPVILTYIYSAFPSDRKSRI